MENGKKLFIGNLPYSVTSDDLDAAFAEAGTVTSAQIVTERETGRPRGFGFVEMETDEMAQAAIIAIVLIFIALVWMFDSIVKSFIILSTIPLSILGVFLGHLIMGLNLTMPGLIGMVGLAGVIVNDGIIMMDFIKKAKNIEELKEYSLLRLRPILLTSLTTILGLSTLIFFASGQSLILQPMAVALGFGILWATVLNLYYVPMLYRLIYLRKDN